VRFLTPAEDSPPGLTPRNGGERGSGVVRGVRREACDGGRGAREPAASRDVAIPHTDPPSATSQASLFNMRKEGP